MPRSVPSAPLNPRVALFPAAGQAYNRLVRARIDRRLADHRLYGRISGPGSSVFRTVAADTDGFEGVRSVEPRGGLQGADPGQERGRPRGDCQLPVHTGRRTQPTGTQLAHPVFPEPT